jgi:primosomal protein N'
MFYYPILTTKKLPVMFYYSSEVELRIGQMVIVNLQNQIIDGIVFDKNKTELEMTNELKLELEKIKAIHKVQPVILQNQQIQFLRFMINNTFNNSGTVLASFLQSFKILNQKHWRQLEVDKITTETNHSENYLKIQNEPKEIITKGLAEIKEKSGKNNVIIKQKPEINFWLESDYTVRIMYIIRNWQQNQQKITEKYQQEKLKLLKPQNKNSKNEIKILDCQKNDFQKLTTNDKKNFFDIVIIFPENKLTDKIWDNFIKNPKWQEFLSKIKTQNWQVENYFFNSKINQKSRSTILELLGVEKTSKKNKLKDLAKQVNGETEQDSEKQDIEKKEENINQKIRIVWGTRSTLFLPFQNLVQVILIDEANSFHIQEQNGLYFDSREAVFLLHKSANCHLDFVSKLPSVRFQNFYKAVSNKTISNFPKNYKEVKNPKIKITTSPQKYYNNNLFSYEIEQILKKEDDIGCFEE